MPKKVTHKGRVTYAHKRKTITLGMMAHGEPLEMFEVIAERLGNRIENVVAVVDTDDYETKANIEKAFSVPVTVHMLPWIDDPYGIGHGDYGANRTRMIELAREMDSDYVLWLDPDDPPKGTIPDELTDPIYIIEIDANGISWGVEHIIRKDVECSYGGLLHEYLLYNRELPVTVLPDVVLERTTAGSTRTDRIESKAIPLLLKIIEDDPTDQHAWYYLAQSYRDASRNAESPAQQDDPDYYKKCSVAAFNKRASMGGFDQTVYWCKFSIAEMTNHIDDYLIAWNYRPQRQEALHRLAVHYNARGQFHVARHFARVALATPPSDDAMFVERWVETYGCLGEWAVSQYNLGELEQAIGAWEYILTLDDVQPHHRLIFEHNLAEAKEPGSGKLASGWLKAMTKANIPALVNEKGTEGTICPDEALFLSELVKSHNGPAKIAETGFGLGWSAWAMLEGNPEITVTSFDLCEYESVKAAKRVIDEEFPGRHTLIEGDSTVTVPEHGTDDFDLVYIDGGHSYEIASADLRNFAKPGRMVVFDDMVPDQQFAEGCVRAWQEAVGPNGYIEEQLVQGAEGHAWAVGVYK